MPEFNAVLFQRKLTNLLVALGPVAVVIGVLANTATVPENIRIWCSAGAGIIAGLGAWLAKNPQSARDLQADALPGSPDPTRNP